eukprot:TRINITY_DN8729_c0_g1_i2.p1 TRINITY_DN8729_c0_g1~~TRINITY_DN8729_c0_g1_i2.p1  ORF type:complete len:867 (-),score=227.53 TRINITY_DN8729_c0_g1_i2:237-2837(-)
MGLPWADLPGLGDEEYPGFPADQAPEEMPDLLGHHNVMADVLKENPGVYKSLRTKQTRLGVTFAKCIKTGMDNRGHPMIKSLGAVAGDAECFDTFAPLFDKLVSNRHGDDRLQRPHSQSVGSRSLTTHSAEPLAGYVLSSQIRLSRNIQGLRFPPAASREELSEAERLLVQAFMTLDDDMKGEYFPLVGSQSYLPKPGGMSEQEEKALRDAGFLFYLPDSTAILSSGSGRHWPRARGIFVNKARTMIAWVNEEDHLRLSSLRPGGDLQTGYREVASVLDAISKSLGSSNGFATSDRLGFLSTSPVNIGTAMKASILGKLPLLKPMQEELNAWAKPRGLLVRNAVDENGLRLAGHVEVTNRDRLGVTEEDSVNRVVEGMAELVLAERLMEQGMSAKEALASVESASDELILDEDDEEHGVHWGHAGDHLGAMICSAVAGTAHSTPAADKSLPAVRERLGASLIDAAKTGNLVAALESEHNKERLDQIRQRVARSLLVASMSQGLDLAMEKLLQDRRLEEQRAATRIQAAVVKQKEEESAAALRIQAIQRGKNERRLVEKQRKEESAAAVRIQAIQRGKQQRRQVEQQKKEETEAASKTEAVQKGKAARRDVAAKKAAAAESEAKPERDDGSLPEIEKLRQQLAVELEASLQNGSLERALSGLKEQPQAPQAEEPDACLLRIGRALEAALEDGRLESALSDQFKVPDLPQQPQAPSAPTAEVFKVPTPPSDMALRGAAAVMKALSNLDRKIGTLQAAIQEAECKIMERSSEVGMLEVELEKAQSDIRCLDGEMQEQMKMVHAEDLRTLQLQDVHRKLIDDFDNETMKTRHAMLNMDANLWSARSELSTASTFADLSSTALTSSLYVSN